jgi:hypothetical protein
MRSGAGQTDTFIERARIAQSQTSQHSQICESLVRRANQRLSTWAALCAGFEECSTRRGAMRSRLSAALIVVAIAAFDARADDLRFGRNCGEWSALSGSSKAAYAAGAFDMLALSSGSAEDLADARGLSSCAVADGFTPKILAGLIDGRYAAHPEEWSAGAATAIRNRDSK